MRVNEEKELRKKIYSDITKMSGDKHKVVQYILDNFLCKKEIVNLIANSENHLHLSIGLDLMINSD